MVPSSTIAPAITLGYNGADPTMRIAVRTFAAYRQAIGQSAMVLEVPPEATPQEVWAALVAEFPGLRRYPPPARYAVNDEFVGPEHRLGEQDEVALIPPVSGGERTGFSAGGAARPGTAPSGTAPPDAAPAAVQVALTRESIDPGALVRSVGDPRAGAVALFCGTVREQSHDRFVQSLEYEAYDLLAEREMRRIAAEAAQRWGVLKVAVVHRLGPLEVGETSVGVAVSSPHRPEAFAAARFIIDTLKQSVPIWKKEVWSGGEEWIGSGR